MNSLECRNLFSVVETEKNKPNTFDNKNPTKNKGDERFNQLSALVLGVAISTGEAIKAGKFRMFDALVGNFGCQLTARDVQEKLRDLELIQEAIQVSEIAQERLGSLDQQRKSIPPEPGESFADYAIRLNVNLPISARLRDLFRFRLLNMIHSCVMKNGLEVPVTDVTRLMKENAPIGKKPLGRLIRDLQVEESAKAVLFARKKAQELVDNDPRKELVSRLLQPEFEKRYLGIVSLPASYNTEAVLKSYQGVVLVENKIKYCGIRNPDSVPQQVWMALPSERQLSPDEIQTLSEDRPILVVEGVVLNGASLSEAIRQYGLVAIVLDSVAASSQYAGVQPGDTGCLDEEALQDLQMLKRNRLNENTFNLDHIYCASVREVRDEK